MRLALWPKKSRERRATVLAGLVLLQALCGLFFIGDAIEDFRDDGYLNDPHLVLETFAAVALTGGAVFLIIELRALLSRISDMQASLDIARGQLAEVIEDFFDEWKLTSAERNVAMMILKGFDNDTIARIRKTAAGTVRAQATSIYAKSGTDGRAQFISLFMEELMAGDLTPVSGADPSPSAKPGRTESPTDNVATKKTT